MAGPWEKYQQAPATESGGPWEKYAQPTSKPKTVSSGKALQTGIEQQLFFGGRPALAGIGGAIGQTAAELTPTQIGQRGLLASLKTVPSTLKRGFLEGRQEARDEEAQALSDEPVAYRAGQGGGFLVTLPLTASERILGTLATGLGTGLLTGASEGESVGDVVKSMVTGGAGALVTRGLFAGGDKIVGGARKIAQNPKVQKLAEKASGQIDKLSTLSAGAGLGSVFYGADPATMIAVALGSNPMAARTVLKGGRLATKGLGKALGNENVRAAIARIAAEKAASKAASGGQNAVGP